MPYNDTFIQSTLYQSPYSGDSWFSGWPRATCQTPQPWSIPNPYKAPGAILCADRYQKTYQPLGRPAMPPPLPPRPNFTSPTPTQAGRVLVSGPSSKGPFLYGHMFGIAWAAQVYGTISSGGAGGQNLGPT
jgi:hypothetical protein